MNNVQLLSSIGNVDTKGVITQIISKYIPTEKQLEAHNCKARYVLYGGAMGGGKTVWLCQEAIEQSMRYPGNRILMARQRLSDFKNTTLVTLFRDMPEGIVAQHNLTERTVHFKNGSVIKYTGLDDDDGEKILKSLEIGSFFFDEASEVSFENFKIATTRLRWTLPDGGRPEYRGFLASNPDDCWLKDRFVDKKGGDDYVFIQSLPTDNKYNVTGYVDQMLKDFDGDELFVSRFINGSWDDLSVGNTVIPKPSIRDCVDKTIASRGQFVMGVDVARFGEDESVFYIGDGFSVVESFQYRGKSTDQVALQAQRFINEFNIGITCIDDIGVGGGVVDMLGSYLGIDGIIGINVGKRADDDRFFNLRAQLWWKARETFSNGNCSIPNDDRLIRQLSAVMYRYRGTGKIIVEPKEDTKKRLGHSPDRADALLLMFHAAGMTSAPARDFSRDSFDQDDTIELGDGYGWSKFYSLK